MQIIAIMGVLWALTALGGGLMYYREHSGRIVAEVNLKGMEGQRDALKEDIKGREKTAVAQADLLLNQDRRITGLLATQQTLISGYTEQKEKLSHVKPEDDGPSAPVLIYVANVLRDAANRVRNGNKAGVPGVPSGSAPSGDPAGGKRPNP